MCAPNLRFFTFVKENVEVMVTAVKYGGGRMLGARMLFFSREHKKALLKKLMERWKIFI